MMTSDTLILAYVVIGVLCASSHDVWVLRWADARDIPLSRRVRIFITVMLFWPFIMEGQ